MWKEREVKGLQIRFVAPLLYNYAEQTYYPLACGLSFCCQTVTSMMPDDFGLVRLAMDVDNELVILSRVLVSHNETSINQVKTLYCFFGPPFPFICL